MSTWWCVSAAHISTPYKLLPNQTRGLTKPTYKPQAFSQRRSTAIHAMGSSSSPLSADVDTSRDLKHILETARDQRFIPSNYVLPVEKRPLPVPEESSIPVIDISGLNGPAEERKQVVDAISSASAEWGCFLINNHGIKVSLMEEMIKSFEEFYSLPWEQKEKYVSQDVMSPVRYGTSLNTPQEHTRHWRDYLRHFGHPVDRSIHLWPNDPPNYRDVAKQYLEESWRLALSIAGAVSEGLGLEKGYVEKSLGEGWQIIAANFYPPCPQPDLTMGLAPHSDHGALTIIMQKNHVDGLQVGCQGKWVPVRPLPGMLTVLLGDYLEILSNGKYKSVEHRGVVNKEKMRISVGVGLGPERDAILAPASQLVNKDGGPKFKPMVYRDYMKLQQTIVSRGKNALKAIAIDAASSILPPSSSSI